MERLMAISDYPQIVFIFVITNNIVFSARKSSAPVTKDKGEHHPFNNSATSLDGFVFRFLFFISFCQSTRRHTRHALARAHST